MKLIRYIEGLEVTQGEGLGGPLRLFPWERRFLRRAFAPEMEISSAALSVARGEWEIDAVGISGGGNCGRSASDRARGNGMGRFELRPVPDYL